MIENSSYMIKLLKKITGSPETIPAEDEKHGRNTFKNTKLFKIFLNKTPKLSRK